MGRKLKKKRPPVIFEAIADEAGPNAAHSVLWMWRIWRKDNETSLPLDCVWAVADAIGSHPAVLESRICIHWDGGAEEYVVCCIIRNEETLEEKRPTYEETRAGISGDVE